MIRYKNLRIWSFTILLLLVAIFVGRYSSTVFGGERSGRLLGEIGGTPIFQAQPAPPEKAVANTQYVITELQDSGTVDMASLQIRPTALPMEHVTRQSKASTVGRGKAYLALSHDLVKESTTNAFGTLATDFTPNESVQFYLNGTLASTFVANATGGYVAVGINTGAGAGYLTIDEIGLTSGKEVGSVIQVLAAAAPDPIVPGVAVGPHSINNTASPLLLLYGWGYPINLTNGITLYRNSTSIGTASTSAAGRYFVSVAAASIPTTPDASAVYGGELASAPAGTYAGASVEERADAGTPPAGDQQNPRAFVDRAFFNSAAAAGFALVAENFLPGEAMNLSGCAAGSLGTADANGSVGVILQAAAGVGRYDCVVTGSTSARVARASVLANANGNTFRGLILQPSLAIPGGNVKVLTTKNTPNDTSTVLMDGVSAGTGTTNASGNGSFVLAKPAAGYLHVAGWATSTGNVIVAPLQIAPGVTLAAHVEVSGRVTATDERGLKNAFVTIMAPDGTSRTVSTGRYGTFMFDEVEVGRTYIISVASRRFSYAPQALSVSDNVSGLIFTPGTGGARDR